MARAFRLHVVGGNFADGYDVVTDSDLREIGKVEATRYSYVCDQTGCHIPVFPVFPEVILTSGSIRKCHFRASTNQMHIGHGSSKNSRGSTAQEVTEKQGQPSGWRDPGPTKNPAHSASNSGLDSLSVDPTTRTPRGANARSVGKAASSTSSLRKLVDRWEVEQPRIREESFILPGRKNQTWKNVFVEVGGREFEAEINRPWRSVFYGGVSRVNRWGAHAFEIEFATSALGRRVRCFVVMSDDEQANNPVLASRLKKLAHRPKGRVYVLAKLTHRGKGRISISVDDCRMVWAML